MSASAGMGGGSRSDCAMHRAAEVADPEAEQRDRLRRVEAEITYQVKSGANANKKRRQV